MSQSNGPGKIGGSSVAGDDDRNRRRGRERKMNEGEMNQAIRLLEDFPSRTRVLLVQLSDLVRRSDGAARREKPVKVNVACATGRRDGWQRQS